MFAMQDIDETITEAVHIRKRLEWYMEASTHRGTRVNWDSTKPKDNVSSLVE